MRVLVVLLALIVLGSVTLPEALAARNNGAIRVPQENLLELGGVVCASINDKWLPGRLLKNGKFLSYAAQIKKQKKRMTKQFGQAQLKAKRKLKQLRKAKAEFAVVCQNATKDPTPGYGSAKNLNFSGAIGVAISGVTSRGLLCQSSNFKKVLASGLLADITEEDLQVAKFLVGPNNKLYALFAQPTDVGDQPEQLSCLLGEIDISTGEATCIDNELAGIKWISAPANDAVQFDAEGAIYYLGEVDGINVLRKYLNGESETLTNENILIDNFLVLSDGSVVLYGSTVNTAAKWIRKLLANGSLQSIKSVQSGDLGVGFIKLFPDNKLYFGISDGNLSGVFTMDQNASSLEQTPWIARGTDPQPLGANCDAVDQLKDTTHCGAKVSILHRTPSNKIYALVGESPEASLMKYYADVSAPDTVVKKITIMQGILSSILLSGLNDNDKNVTTLFDTSDNSELQLIGPENEIEVYHLRYFAPGSGELGHRVVFDGLRFSDNEYVIGFYDLGEQQLYTVSTGGYKLVDLQTF